MPNFVRFDAGMLKLQQMIKWDVFLGHGVEAANSKRKFQAAIPDSQINDLSAAYSQQLEKI